MEKEVDDHIFSLMKTALSAADDNKAFSIEARPQRFSKIIPDYDTGKFKYGIIPEIVITNRYTGKVLLLEVKRQGTIGNANERIFKYVSPQGVKNFQRALNINYNPFYFIFYDSLCTQSSYISKFAWYLEPDRYYLWQEFPALNGLSLFLRRLFKVTQ